MNDSAPPPPVEDLVDLLEREKREAALGRLDEVGRATAADRKAAIRALEPVAEDRPSTFDPIVPALARFLDDEERSVRLTTAKLFVALAESEPDVVVPAVSALADRLADGDEFYYVRARAAEALGYVVLEPPGAVAWPGLLADLRVGLSVDGPEVSEKLAKALTCVVLGDPDRLRHQVASLAEHLDAGSELVRYHLTTALVVVGCEHPGRLADAGDALAGRLDDGSPYVRGRAAEALGLLARAAPDDVPLAADDLPRADGGPFVVDRMRFARRALANDGPTDPPDGIGTVEAIRGTTDGVVAEITSPDGDGECPHCGLALPADGPPMCPQCGAPY